MELFGFQFPPKKKEDKRELEQKQSFVPSEPGDGALAVEYAPSGFISSYINLDYHAVNDTQLILKYRDVAMHPEVESAIEQIVGEAIITQDWNSPVKIITDKLDYPKSIRDKIAEEFESIITLLNFNTKGYELFRRWYIDSRLVHHVIIDESNKKAGIQSVKFVDPINIRKIREIKQKILEDGNTTFVDKEEYYVYRHDGFRGGAGGVDTQGIKISPDAISYVTSGLYDSNKKMVIGYLHKAIKAVNQLRLMEDALIIYRLSRAPERRIFNVEVGNMTPRRADAYLRDLMNRHRNKPVYDVQTGGIMDSARHMAMLEDFWLPTSNGKGTSISNLPGGQNLGQIEDINFFLKKVYKSLGLPTGRMMEDNSGGINFSGNSEITRDEIRFSKFIQRLRNKFSELFYDLLKKQLMLKNIIRDETEWNENIRDYVFFDYIKDSYYSEAKNNEIWVARANLLSLLDPYVGTILSRHWVMSQILGFNDREIQDMTKEIEKEKKLGQNVLTTQTNTLPDLNDLNALGQDAGAEQDPFGGADQEQQAPDGQPQEQSKNPVSESRKDTGNDEEFQKI